MRTIIIWGAGRIGRGFVADLFSEAEDFRTVFVDLDAELISQLNKTGRYTIAKATRSGIREKCLEGDFEAVHTGNMVRLSELFGQPELLLDIAVHEPKLSQVADMLVPLIERRAKTGLSMDVMMNVNMHRPDERFRSLMRERLTGPVLDYFDSQVGVTGIFAMCISPFAPDWLRDKDPLAIWNNGWETQSVSRQAFKCALPQAPRLLFTDDIEREETRKLYTLNMSHALLSYLGLPLGLKTSLEAVRSKELYGILSQALTEACTGLERRFGFGGLEMAVWKEKIISLLENPYIEDDLKRLGADSRRKLSAGDRLLGPARLSLQAEKKPVCLAKAIRAGFEYENPDEGTQAVRQFYKAHGLAASLKEFCGLEPDEELFKLILSP